MKCKKSILIDPIQPYTVAEEAKEITRDSEAARKRYHELSQAILKRQTKNAQKLVNTIEVFINPFSYQEDDIIICS